MDSVTLSIDGQEVEMVSPQKTGAGLTKRNLMKNGFTKVYALKGGWRDWFRNKFPAETK